MTGGSVAIKFDDDAGKIFPHKKGLTQGDPLPPMIFNIVADMLDDIIERTKNDGQIKGVSPRVVDGGLSIFQCRRYNHLHAWNMIL
jgi:hypothetical protein